MIKWLVKEGEEQDLAWLAMVLPLASLCLWIPGVLVLVPLQFFLSEQACGLMLLALLVGWAVFVLFIWVRAVKIIRQAKVREVSPWIFHLLQGVALLLVAVNILVKRLAWSFFPQWIVCMDVALAIFYVSYFLLALTTRTKIPWHAAAGFGMVCLSLAVATMHNPFGKL
ncbi:MAG TPA: hypothetical protein VH251_01375 [Verrucomicrobiae bacterium]|jgi:hypothetical protein|nr:hypothetical protein [Verrucomicrobiae bacterium]